jgi:hypothetical protein
LKSAPKRLTAPNGDTTLLCKAVKVVIEQTAAVLKQFMASGEPKWGVDNA